jgi:hypothetical protein
VVVVGGKFLRSRRRRSKDLRKWPGRPSHPSSLIMFFSLERTPLDDLPEDMWKWGWRSLGVCVWVCVVGGLRRYEEFDDKWEWG